MTFTSNCLLSYNCCYINKQKLVKKMEPTTLRHSLVFPDLHHFMPNDNELATGSNLTQYSTVILSRAGTEPFLAIEPPPPPEYAVFETVPGDFDFTQTVESTDAEGVIVAASGTVLGSGEVVEDVVSCVSGTSSRRRLTREELYTMKRTFSVFLDSGFMSRRETQSFFEATGSLRYARSVYRTGYLSSHPEREVSGSSQLIGDADHGITFIAPGTERHFCLATERLFRTLLTGSFGVTTTSSLASRTRDNLDNRVGEVALRAFRGGGFITPSGDIIESITARLNSF